MRSVVTLGMAVALLALGGCGSLWTDIKAGHARREADRYLAQGDYAKAHAQYAKVLKLRPTGELAFKDAYCLRKSGDPSGGVGSLAKASELGMGEARVVLAPYGGVTTDALREFVRTHETEAYAWAALGDRLYSAGEYDEAAEAYETASGVCDDAQLGQTLSYNLSVAHLRARRYAESERAFNAYVARIGKPLTDEERYLLGVIRYSRGDCAGAAEVWSGLPAQARRAVAERLGDESRHIAALGSD